MLPLDELERAAVAAGCLTVRDEPMNRHTTFRIGGCRSVCDGVQ